jgi:hypothetical protein
LDLFVETGRFNLELTRLQVCRTKSVLKFLLALSHRDRDSSRRRLPLSGANSDCKIHGRLQAIEEDAAKAVVECGGGCAEHSTGAETRRGEEPACAG